MRWRGDIGRMTSVVSGARVGLILHVCGYRTLCRMYSVVRPACLSGVMHGALIVPLDTQVLTVAETAD